MSVVLGDSSDGATTVSEWFSVQGWCNLDLSYMHTHSHTHTHTYIAIYKHTHFMHTQVLVCDKSSNAGHFNPKVFATATQYSCALAQKLDNQWSSQVVVTLEDSFLSEMH